MLKKTKFPILLLILYIFFFSNFISDLVSLRLSAIYVFVCVYLLARWRYGVRIVGMFLLPGCVLGACVGNGPIGCTNNNYASREICKKCGQPKEVAAMPATAIPGASLQTYPNYFTRAPSGFDQRTGYYGSGAPQQSLSLTSNWSLGGTNKYGFQPASTWPAGGNHNTSFAHAAPANPLMTTNGWRNGDWICSCGYHNYSSRTQCKKCNASVPSTPAAGLGTKRLASDELAHGLDSKRLNAGQTHATMPQTYSGTDNMGLSNYNQPNVKYPSYMSGTSPLTPSFQVNLQTSTMPLPAPTIFGKGAKHWRDGDWVCVKCSNHNYASRSQCNRCKTEREVLPGPGPGPVTVT